MDCARLHSTVRPLHIVHPIQLPQKWAEKVSEEPGDTSKSLVFLRKALWCMEIPPISEPAGLAQVRLREECSAGVPWVSLNSQGWVLEADLPQN